MEAILDKGEQPAVLGPAEVKDGPVHANSSEVLHALFAVMGKHKVVRRRAVLAATDEGHRWRSAAMRILPKGPRGARSCVMEWSSLRAPLTASQRRKKKMRA